MEAYFHLIWLIVVVVSAVLAAFKIDPDRKYRSVVIKVLTQVKDVTPDNVDEVIDLIIGALEGEGLDVEKKVVKKIILEVREDAKENPVAAPVKDEQVKEASPVQPKRSPHTHDPHKH